MFISQTDDDPTHDHTYYGNGCPNQWMVTDDRPCTTRIVKDKNNEDQKNGTYYNFQAATSGKGGAISTDNTNSPDTFCPLGWQLPYGGTGGDYYNKSRSWAFLLTKYENGLASFPYYPFSYVFSGFYYWASGYGKAYDMTYGGTYWSLTNSNSTSAYRANLWNNGGDISGSSRGGKNYGSTIRCVYHFSIPLIDGTVAGTNVEFGDSDWIHDYSYYGNGCPNEWDTSLPHNGQSNVSCSSREIQADDGNQKIGTYYNFSAATVHTNRTLYENQNAPDTFCPLGWQLPYSGTGGDYYDKSRSWSYLLEYYSIENSQIGSQKLQSYPFSYIRSGMYSLATGLLYGQGTSGSSDATYHPSITNKAKLQHYRFNITRIHVTPNDLVGKGGVEPFRCVRFLASLIDGTVAGNPANMTVAPYKDGTVANDHTYYGRGCNNSWGTSGEGGSQTPCPDSNAGGRYVKTADNETQKNGTYYNFQAGTSGAGAAITTDNTNSSDTFCPLGWQLPYSGTGGDYYNKSRSWNKLFTEYNIAFGDGTAADATKIKSYPFSYVYSGYYGWNTGRLYYQSNGGVYWSSTVVSSTNAYYLRTWSSGVRSASTGSKAGGFTLRCVKFLASSHRRHGGRN